jgi:hypothetical protein
VACIWSLPGQGADHPRGLTSWGAMVGGPHHHKVLHHFEVPNKVAPETLGEPLGRLAARSKGRNSARPHVPSRATEAAGAGKPYTSSCGLVQGHPTRGEDQDRPAIGTMTVERFYSVS